MCKKVKILFHCVVYIKKCISCDVRPAREFSRKLLQPITETVLTWDYIGIYGWKPDNNLRDNTRLRERKIPKCEDNNFDVQYDNHVERK